MKIKRKTNKAKNFLEYLHHSLINYKLLRKNTFNKKEEDIQRELRHCFYDILRKYFQDQGYKDFDKKADDSFYWEGEERKYKSKKVETFASRSYPDFIITEPYKIAIEYKKSKNGSIVKEGIGQSLIHTKGGEFDFVYCLIQDESKSKKIVESQKNKKETKLKEWLFINYNIKLEII